MADTRVVARERWKNNKMHWTKRRKVEDLERMIRDVEENRVVIKGRDPVELLAHLRDRLSALSDGNPSA